jgi:hypothetical protein
VEATCGIDFTAQFRQVIVRCILIGWGFIVPVYPKANINTICTTFSTDSPIDNNIQLCLVIITWQDIFKVGHCKCTTIGKELFSTRSGKC